MRPVTRIEPKIPASQMQTYQIVAPVPTHWIAATCDQVDCQPYLKGWTTLIDTSTEFGQKQYYYITKQSGRSFTETKTGPTTVSFTFGPGQRCFKSSEHKVRKDKQEIYVVRHGDWRQRTGSRRQFTGRTAAADWVDHFATHQSALSDAIQKG